MQHIVLVVVQAWAFIGSCTAYPNPEPGQESIGTSGPMPTGVFYNGTRRQQQDNGIPTITLIPQQSGSATPSVDLANTDRTYTEVSSSLIFAAQGKAADDMAKDVVLKCNNKLDAYCIKELSGAVKTPALTLQGRAIGAAFMLVAFAILTISAIIKEAQQLGWSREHLYAAMDTKNANSIESVKLSSTVAFLTKSGDPLLSVTVSNDEVVATPTNAPAHPTRISATGDRSGVDIYWPPEVETLLGDKSLRPADRPDFTDKKQRLDYANRWAENIASTRELSPGKQFWKDVQNIESLWGKLDDYLQSKNVFYYLLYRLYGSLFNMVNEVATQGFMTRERKVYWGMKVLLECIMVALWKDWLDDDGFVKSLLSHYHIYIPLSPSQIDPPPGPQIPKIEWGDAKLQSVPDNHNGDFSVRLDLTENGDDSQKVKFKWTLFLGLNGQGNAIESGDGSPEHNRIPVDRGRLFAFFDPDLIKDFTNAQFVWVDWTEHQETIQASPSLNTDPAHPPKFPCRTVTPPGGVSKSLLCSFPLNPQAPDGNYRIHFVQQQTENKKKGSLQATIVTDKSNEEISGATVYYKDGSARQMDLNGFKDLGLQRGEKVQNMPWYRFQYPMQGDHNGRVRVTIKAGLADDGGIIIIAHGYQIFITGPVKNDVRPLKCDVEASKNFYSCGDGCRERRFECSMPDRI